MESNFVWDCQGLFWSGLAGESLKRSIESVFYGRNVAGWLNDWKDRMGFSTNDSSNVRNSNLTPEVSAALHARLTTSIETAVQLGFGTTRALNCAEASVKYDGNR